MSLHINRFIDRLKAADSRNQRDFTMSMIDAKNLHADITKLLLAIQEMQDRSSSTVENPDIKVELTGGTF
jgi:hypothetical protein